ncbi:MAG: hypothetical protein QOF68_2895 [Gaiellales bacterium]|nr:hypothetical protein [Gaiellales bacterium]
MPGQVPARRAKHLAHRLRAPVGKRRPVTERHHHRLEALERRPRRKRTSQRVHPKPVAGRCQEKRRRAQRLGAVQQPAAGKPEQRLVPAAPGDHGALVHSGKAETGASQRPRSQARSVKPPRELLGIPLMAVEQRRNADHMPGRGKLLFEPGDVDRV